VPEQRHWGTLLLSSELVGLKFKLEQAFAEKQVMPTSTKAQLSTLLEYYMRLCGNLEEKRSSNISNIEKEEDSRKVVADTPDLLETQSADNAYKALMADTQEIQSQVEAKYKATVCETQEALQGATFAKKEEEQVKRKQEHERVNANVVRLTRREQASEHPVPSWLGTRSATVTCTQPRMASSPTPPCAGKPCTPRETT
jgi:hypothetical protein